MTAPSRNSPRPRTGDGSASDQPLTERAATAARAELRGDRAGILGAIGHPAPQPLLARARRVPERWSFLHVMERMEESFRILARLPIATRPRGYVNSMPYYLYDRGDLNAQMETYELERMTRMRNRVRIAPSPAEIARMEEALRWPTLFLSGAEFHHIARAVNLGSLWAAFDADVDAGLKRLRVTRRAFNARKLQGHRARGRRDRGVARLAGIQIRQPILSHVPDGGLRPRREGHSLRAMAQQIQGELGAPACECAALRLRITASARAGGTFRRPFASNRSKKICC